MARAPRISKKFIERKIIHIYTEGETEKFYFSILKSSSNFRKKASIKIKCISKRKQGKALIEEVQNSLRKLPKYDKPDKVYIIFDKDDLSNIEVVECISKQNSGLVIGYSNPSFEVWLISHYENIFRGRSITQKDLERKLSSALGEPYRKADVNQITSILNNIEQAHINVQNISSLSTYNCSVNPYTNISLLINDMLE
jgi:hypothetical protein